MSAHPRKTIRVLNETKIFDPRDPSSASNGAELTDATVVRRGNQWWMYLGGQAAGYGPTQLYSAALPVGAPLSATGWSLARNFAGVLIPLAGHHASAAWDAKGGRHCPSYVKGIDPHTGKSVERIYYAGAAENLWGPYTIGYLEWSGSEWIDQPSPAFTATQDWEHGSVYEPNLIYADGKWKMWYVAGSNFENYLIHGYTESEDGRTNWSEPKIFAPEEMKLFDFCVSRHKGSYEAVFSRVWLAGTPPPSETGLWWCHCDKPSSNLSDWSEPVQIMNAEDKGWRTGPWKPSFAHNPLNPSQAFVFFDGAYRTDDPGPFPFAFTTGCVELDLL
jgi:hypothetical protein